MDDLIACLYVIRQGWRWRTLKLKRMEVGGEEDWPNWFGENYETVGGHYERHLWLPKDDHRECE